MPRKQRAKSVEDDTHLALRIEEFDASVFAGINHDALAPEFAWPLDEDDPVYKFTNQLRMSAIVTWPNRRLHERFALTIVGDDRHSMRLSARLKDIRETDSDGSPRYRSYRGKEIRVLAPPHGLGSIDKVRGERAWRSWLFVAPRFVDQCRALLIGMPDVFLALHEWKSGRSRWVRSLSLHTTDPAED